jgi:hypothetical protein
VDDFVTPFSDHFAQRTGPINLPVQHYRLPGNARTIVGNDSIADHPEIARLEFAIELSGCHASTLRSSTGGVCSKSNTRVLIHAPRDRGYRLGAASLALRTVAKAS